MDASPLGKLPPELRIRIYKLVLLTKGRINIKSHHSVKRAPLNLDLTMTCKLIRTESLPIFYSKNKFQFGCPHQHAWFGGHTSEYVTVLKICSGWLEKIGHHNASSISFFSITGGTLDPEEDHVSSHLDLTAARLLECTMLGSTGLPFESLYNSLTVSVCPDIQECPYTEDCFAGHVEVEARVCNGYDFWQFEDEFELLEEQLVDHGRHNVRRCQIAMHTAASLSYIKTARFATEMMSIHEDSDPILRKVKDLWNTVGKSCAVNEEV